MTGKPRVPHGGGHGTGHGGDGSGHPHDGSGHPEGGDGTGGKKPSTTHGNVDASKSVSGAQESVSQAAHKGRPGQGQEQTPPTTTTPTTPVKPNFENPGFDDRKLTEYALNPDHPVGGNKAKVIESVTGLGKADAATVKQQILDQVKQGDPIPGKVDEHGSRFAKDVTLTGPNGTIVVRTAWIVDATTGETRLATVSFPPKAKK
jgi:hypothetical protein